MPEGDLASRCQVPHSSQHGHGVIGEKQLSNVPHIPVSKLAKLLQLSYSLEILTRLINL